MQVTSNDVLEVAIDSLIIFFAMTQKYKFQFTVSSSVVENIQRLEYARTDLLNLLTYYINKKNASTFKLLAFFEIIFILVQFS